MKEFEFGTVKYYVGQSAKENWELLSRADQSYIWFHLDSFSSPYVIMWSSINNLEEIIKISVDISSVNQFLYYGAELCKKYSKYKNQRDIKIVFTDIKNISKGKKEGEAIIKNKKQIIKI